MLAAWQIDPTRVIVVLFLLVACPSLSVASQKATNFGTATDLPQLAANVTPEAAPEKISSPEAKEPSEGTTPAAVPPVGTASPTDTQPKTAGAPTPVDRVEQPQEPEVKSQSILQMIEGRESEVKYGLIIAAAAFLLGWICGGAFYARRERRSRHKLRF